MSNGIIHVRVDDRMLHGIVATDWIPKSGATRAMVIDPAASTNDIVRSSLKMACPTGIALSVLDPRKAADNILSGKYSAQRVFVICRYIQWAYSLFKAGVPMEQINLGNVTQNKGDVTVLDKTVRVSPEEKEMLRKMRDTGIKITVRLRPDNAEIDVSRQLD
ncbi:PTS sugar transporter subunit IIB [Caproicibacter fermentans]|uniref:PTS sugar transporter subunit IIB n=1 Tax=Caproicibacter fermentans TaxID=2576756 RepID=A0A7G8T657_9FIRM|nr:PTS sugar transporter subunit IIB [Caproicibacter fermentans]QNK39098.1 PTS sugar transporter subunit IIB [Caproicibacter fermentans]